MLPQSCALSLGTVQYFHRLLTSYLGDVYYELLSFVFQGKVNALVFRSLKRFPFPARTVRVEYLILDSRIVYDYLCLRVNNTRSVTSRYRGYAKKDFSRWRRVPSLGGYSNLTCSPAKSNLLLPIPTPHNLG